MINVTKTYLPHLKKYEKYVEKIFKSGWLTNNGELVRKLQTQLKEYLGIKNIVLVSNGTLALQLAYKLLNLKGKVITTPFSFVATVSSQVWEGLSPKFVDIDKKTFNINPNKIISNINQDTAAIVPVHVFGNSCEVEKIDTISKDLNLKVIYDAAHAFGVKYKGESVLNYGDISTLSFHATKVFHTIEGGALVMNDDELYHKAQLMINFGIKCPECIEDLGINAKMNEFQAAMGLCVLEDIDKILEGRKKVYEYYMNNLPNSLTFQKKNEDGTLNYGYFPVVFREEEVLIRVKENLNNEGIYPRRYFYPSLHELSYIRKQRDVPNSSYISKLILCLPIYYSMELNVAKKIVEIIKNQI
ncbi:DegT/DnrJ/EryC1/StrS family aminotransferase [Clostridium magnum]|uniref:dTDP-4-amino-4,6-dideoxy-D-glucose transaminase n=1 Tax=Clostridium magnum DSM 2767 TaxID=1121326 RepID=A0A162U9U3_9CLOT|nr:DegT/DnrJ/EryC1/StrS family aminotransferase [Clostridium magnum]KZL93681.1 dTDP-4-amino-4,6-dideoxy-D-glucose transaminase [Clostridium magnum DSM 2767]SHI92381.1 dTDP-4-amino-4,6-dideoxygalactose transaminase [Clostridium magnum DSM 2767]